MSARWSVRAGRWAGVIAVLLAVVVVVFGVGAPLVQSGKYGAWAETRCTIVESYVQERTETEPWGNDTREFTVYAPQITYAYTWDGEEYESSGLGQLKKQSRDEAWADSIVNAFPEGAERTCYVNPSNPQEAALEVQGGPEAWAFGLAAIILVLFGVWLLIRGG